MTVTRKRLALSALMWLTTTICVHAQSAEQPGRAEIDGLMGRYTGDGKLRLQDRVREWLPQLPARTSAVLSASMKN